MSEQKLTPKDISIDGWEPYMHFNALCGRHWNGWETPHVTLQTIELINEFQEVSIGKPYTWHFDIYEDDDMMKVFFTDKEEHTLCDAIIIDGVYYYDISNGLIWSEYNADWKYKGEMLDRRFCCGWKADNYDNKAEMVNINFFTLENGYEVKDLESIRKMQVGDFLLVQDCADGTSSHCIMRVDEASGLSPELMEIEYIRLHAKLETLIQDVKFMRQAENDMMVSMRLKSTLDFLERAFAEYTEIN